MSKEKGGTAADWGTVLPDIPSAIKRSKIDTPPPQKQTDVLGKHWVTTTRIYPF